MIVKKNLPITDDIITDVLSIINDFVGTGIGVDLESAVKTALTNQVDFILNQYKFLGLNIIGKWYYDTDEEEYYLEGLEHIVKLRLLKYYPFLKVLSSEFSTITGRETTYREHSGSIEKSGTEEGTFTKGKTESKNVGYTKQRSENDSYNNSANGVSRSASEDSPITEAPITNAPAESAIWNLASPSKKAGEQFNDYGSGQNAKTESENDTEVSSIASNETDTDSKEIAGTEEETGNETIHTDNPNELLRILRFNVDELNITKISYMFVNSFIEEKNTIY